MREEVLEFLCCPICKEDLELHKVLKTREHEIASGFLACSKCGRLYEVKNGIPDLLPPEFIKGSDKRWMIAYDRSARSYYILMHIIMPALSLWTEVLARSEWVARLGLRRGDMALDVSTGTGRNLPFLLKRVGHEGLVFGMDISKGMLAYAARLVRAKGWHNVELQRANAAYLPYRDNMFDGVLHVGGINTFEDKVRALAEMVRVAKPGARVVIVDEGLEPNKRKTLIGRFLLRTNALYFSMPPEKPLREQVEDLKVEWGVVPCWAMPMWPFYVMEARKPLR